MPAIPSRRKARTANMNCVKNQIKFNFFKVLLNSNLVDTGCCFLPLQIPVLIVYYTLLSKLVFLFFH